MKQFIKSILWFSGISIILYIIIVAIAGWIPFKNLNYKQGAYGHMTSRINEINDYNNVDILFLGSSHAYRGLDPRIFEKHGFTSFNLGSSAQTPIQSCLLFKRYCDNLSPEIAIYEISPLTFLNDGVESSLDIIANTNISIETIKMAFQINNLKTYNALLYAICRKTLNFKKYNEPKVIGEDSYIQGGFVEREITYYSDYKNKSSQTKSIIQDIIESDQLTYFQETVHQLKSTGVQTILIQTPVTSRFYKDYNPLNTQFDSLMASFGVPYYNFNKIMIMNDSLDFYDRHHLNQIGVEKFNNQLIEILDLK